MRFFFKMSHDYIGENRHPTCSRNVHRKKEFIRLFDDYAVKSLL